jgi:hypothetical protein
MPTDSLKRVYARHAGWLAPLVIFVAHVAITLPWVYVRGAGEPDSNAMLTGVYQSVLQGTWFSGTLYMLHGQPLYYAMAFALQGPLQLGYTGFAFLMNLLSCFMAAGCSVLVYQIALFFTRRAAAFMIALFTISSATVWEWSTYTHPVTLSHLLVLLSIYAILRALQGGGLSKSWWRLGWYCGGIVAGVAAMAARADVAVLFHLFIILPVLYHTVAEGNWRFSTWRTAAFAGAFAGVCAGAMGIATISLLLPGAAEGSNRGTASSLLATLRQVLSFIPPVDALLEALFGFGVVGGLFWGAAFCLAVLRRRWVAAVAAVLIVAPPLIYAMGNVQPARRWFPVIYGMAIALGVLLPKNGSVRGPRGLFVGIGTAAIVLNLYLLPLLGHGLRRSGVDVDSHTILYRTTADVLGHHRVNQAYLDNVYAQMRDLRTNAPEGSLLVGGFAQTYFLLATYCQGGVVAKFHTRPHGQYGWITEVAGPDKSLFVAEAVPGLKLPPLPGAPPAIYQMGQVLPREWEAQTTRVVRLHPPRAERYSMWLRRP